MEQLINDLFEIIKDYRADEGFMSPGRITTWVNQFDDNDRIFLLEEMNHILKQRYVSKNKAKALVKSMIEFLSKNEGYDTPLEFLLESAFIDHQPEGKSQKILLQFLDEIIQDEYGIKVSDCNPYTAKFYIYFDDILCTGDTLVKGLTMNTDDHKGWFFQADKNGKTNWELFQENSAKLVLAYFSIHKLNIKKAMTRIYHGLGEKDFKCLYAWDTEYEVENDVSEPKSKLNYFFPQKTAKDTFVAECQDQIEAKIKNAGYHLNDTIQYRKVNMPQKEEFFSSSANRDRFEKIVLDKSIEIYNTSPNLMSNLRPKPMGYGLKTDLSFGFGALIFTWRNVPFNVPLVFWYKSQHWTSLFERKFVTYE
jgi:hypothetical protein